MGAGLDTSAVLRLLIGEPPEQASVAWKYVSRQSASPSGPAAVSDLVVAESYFALRHHYGVPHGEAVGSLIALLKDPRLRATGLAPAALSAARQSSRGAGLIDRLIHADYARDGLLMLTFDKAAAALEHATLISERR